MHDSTVCRTLPGSLQFAGHCLAALQNGFAGQQPRSYVCAALTSRVRWSQLIILSVYDIIVD